MTDLPPFTVDARCPKCGSRRIRTHHRLEYQDDLENPPEVMRRHCKSCDYGWDEAPLDATPAEPEVPTTLELAQRAMAIDREPSIPVSRIVAVLAERYMGMYEVKQRHTGIDRVSYHSRSLEDAWVSAALGIDHEFDAALGAELARQRTEATDADAS